MAHFFFGHVFGNGEFLDQEVLSQIQHLPLPEREVLVAPQVNEIPQDFRNLIDRTGLDLFHILAVAAVPGLTIDLSVFFGYEDYDLKGMEVIPGKTLKKKFDSIKQIEKLNLNDLYKDGYTNVVLNSNKMDREYTSLPVNISLNSSLSGKDDEIKLEKPANFIIKKDGEIVYVVINGFVYNIKNQTGEIKNGLIYH